MPQCLCYSVIDTFLRLDNIVYHSLIRTALREARETDDLYHWRFPKAGAALERNWRSRQPSFKESSSKRLVLCSIDFRGDGRYSLRQESSFATVFKRYPTNECTIYDAFVQLLRTLQVDRHDVLNVGVNVRFTATKVARPIDETQSNVKFKRIC